MGTASSTGQSWAKSPDADGKWLSLAQHMQDSASVAQRLIDTWLATGTLSGAADKGWSGARLRAVGIFLAGGHDAGKATPAFAHMSPVLHAAMVEAGLGGTASVSGRQCHHTRTGFHLMLDYLRAKGLDHGAAYTWAVVVAGHHGAVPSVSELVQASPTRYPDFYGWDQSVQAQAWKTTTTTLLDQIWQMSGLANEAGSDIAKWPPLPLSAQVTLGGLVIMADWIASNTALFPLGDALSDRVDLGVAALQLPRPWRPSRSPDDPATLYADRFNLFASLAPRPFQIDAVHAARWLPEPGLILLEAAPGEGKTEAALAVAEVLAQRFGMGGVFVALPTQATTDAMFGRVLTWLDHLGEDELPVGSTAWLGHSRRRLNRLYRGLPTIRLSEIHDGDGCPQSRVAAHDWLTRKKALLATTVVATIDQLLLTSLTLKHGALRFLGLASKVVVIDEVHAYDPFMRTHLLGLLRWLAELKVPVVMLSATLPSAIRRELVEAYVGSAPGLGMPPEAIGTAYPLITAACRTGVKTWAPAASGRTSEVALERISDDDQAIAASLEELLAEGGCALVVRNTVKTARATAAVLRERLGVQVECHHARFLAADRQANDDRLLCQFGHPDLVKSRGGTRPARAIVVATQVAEMSLDVDFDLLVTDLAPMDAILQRLGRCHRHPRQRPPGLIGPRCLVISDLAADAAPQLSDGSCAIYGEAVLLATAAQLEPRFGGALRLPDDIVPLVEASYVTNPDVPEPWRASHAAARVRQEAVEATRRATARSMELRSPEELAAEDDPPTLIGWMNQGGVANGDETDPLVQAAVRDGRPSVEFMLVTSDESGSWQIPARMGSGPRLLDVSRPPTPSEAEAMAGCLIRITPPRWRPAFVLARALTAATPEPWRDLPSLGRVPVIALAPEGAVTVDDLTVTYDSENGMELQW